jgi:hypothetical protein
MVCQIFEGQKLARGNPGIEGLFDEVIAPDHAIGGSEALSSLIGQLHWTPLAKIRPVFKNWNKSVMLKRK